MHKKKILIADDDEFILELVRMALEEKGGYEVVKVRNGQEALDAKENEDFDLIITDIIMPEVDGIKFIDELKKMKSTIPIIAISGGDEGGNIDEYINFAGYFANETLTKPFTKEELLRVVSMVVNNRDPEIFTLFY